MQLLLKGGRLIDPPTGRDESFDILVSDGRIERIGKSLAASAAQVIELKGKIVAPGFIDMHVHFREPGFEYKESIASGCEAAANGGFTAVCCMPNTNPPIDDESLVHFIHARARVAMGGLVDVYPIGAVTAGRKGEHLAPLAELAAAGAIGFSDDGEPVHDAELMRRALEYSAMFTKPIIQHAQEPSLSKGGVANEGYPSVTLGLPPMPRVAEEIMVARDIRLMEYAGGQYHVAHVSAAETLDHIRGAKVKKLPVTCEVTPHHFTLVDEALAGFDTNTKMNPPLRTREDVEALKAGLKDGTIDVIATDHAPHSYDEKEVEFAQAPFGIIGLETAIGLAITELVKKNVLTLPELIEKFSTNPRRLLHLPAIAIAEGEMANITIFDPVAEWVVDPSAFKSHARNTPFGRTRLTGRPVGVLNNGVAYWG
jgi:dihydroorotase